MGRYYCYRDISLIPELGVVGSRSEAETWQTFLDREYRMPVFPSNMKCTINADLAKQLSADSYFYIMHRFDHDQLEFVKNAQNWNLISISVGVKPEDIELIKKIAEENLKVHVITIDVAHGHHLWVRQMIKTINSYLGSRGIKIIAGNVATAEGAKYLSDSGADAVKVGIGQGMACTTKDKTGFTLPMFTCVRNIYDRYPDIPLIADGGIRCNGDVAKALVAGADMVMAGGIFAQLSDSPSRCITGVDGKNYKEYYGSASSHNKGHNKNVEGTLVCITAEHMTYKEKLDEMQQDLQSSISYSGEKNIKRKALAGVRWAALN
jgi:GMP reductase